MATSLPDPQGVLDRLLELQRAVRDVVIRSRESSGGLHEVTRSSSADTIYRIDAEVDPILESFCAAWGKTTPLVLVATEEEGTLIKSFRNLPRSLVTIPSELEVSTVLWAKSLLVTEAALPLVEARAAHGKAVQS